MRPILTPSPTRRSFLHGVSMLMAAPALLAAHPSPAQGSHSELDAARMRALVDWTMLTMQTPNPVPYGAEIFGTRVVLGATIADALASAVRS